MTIDGTKADGSELLPKDIRALQSSLGIRVRAGLWVHGMTSVANLVTGFVNVKLFLSYLQLTHIGFADVLEMWWGGPDPTQVYSGIFLIAIEKFRTIFWALVTGTVGPYILWGLIGAQRRNRRLLALTVRNDIKNTTVESTAKVA